MIRQLWVTVLGLLIVAGLLMLIFFVVTEWWLGVVSILAGLACLIYAWYDTFGRT